MGAVLELLAILLSRVAAITGLVQLLASAVQAIQNYLNPKTGISQITAIQNLVEVVKFDVADSTYSLLAIKTELDALQASVTALGSPQQAGGAVTLPTTPPAGYGITGADIWSEVLSTDVPVGRAGDLLAGAGLLANFLTTVYGRFPMYYPGGWDVGGAWNEANQAAPNVNVPPQFDPATILVTDASMGAWVARAYPASGVYLSLDGQMQVNNGSDSWVYTWMWTEADFQGYKASAFGVAPVTVNVAPVWPGVANVTMGDSVALTEALHVNVPMDGCVITLDTVPPGKPTYTIGDVVATAHIGQLLFKCDADTVEYPQNLSMDEEFYVPQTMVHATGVKIRTIQGVSGSVTPFTINP